MSDEPTKTDDATLREQQRQVRIKLGHETDWGAGIVRDGVGIAPDPTTTTANDPTLLMLEAIARRRRGLLTDIQQREKETES